MPFLQVLWSLLVAFAMTLTVTQPDLNILVRDEDRTIYQVGLNGSIYPIPLSAQSSTATPVLRMPQAVLDHHSLFAPLPIFVHQLAWADSYLYAMTGQADPIVNLYAVVEGELGQLTDVIQLFPEASPPVLSASVEFIAVRPNSEGAFLYRARLRDAAGIDHNALFVYDPASDTPIPMPFFGKTPVWSPDGNQLVGSRLDDHDSAGYPLYSLWISDLVTGQEQQLSHGCNPQWSPDGEWIAYEGHDSSQWQNYTDCFSNGQVMLLNVETLDINPVVIPEAIGALELIGWGEPTR